MIEFTTSLAHPRCPKGRIHHDGYPPQRSPQHIRGDAVTQVFNIFAIGASAAVASVTNNAVYIAFESRSPTVCVFIIETCAAKLKYKNIWLKPVKTKKWRIKKCNSIL